MLTAKEAFAKSASFIDISKLLDFVESHIIAESSKGGTHAVIRSIECNTDEITCLLNKLAFFGYRVEYEVVKADPFFSRKNYDQIKSYRIDIYWKHANDDSL